jgi:hypothetical protein
MIGSSPSNASSVPPIAARDANIPEMSTANLFYELWTSLRGESPEAGSALEARVRGTSKLLGSDEWSVRKGAADRLRWAGVFSLPILEQAMQADDPKLRHAAEHLLNRYQILAERIATRAHSRKDSRKISRTA